MPTAQDQINRALRLNNVIAANEAPNSSDTNISFRALNSMIDLWNTEQLMVYQFEDVSHTLTGGVSSYSVGPGADIDITRPVRIQGSYISVTDDIDRSVDILNKDDYDMINNKTVQGYPRSLFYDPSFPAGLINLWPIPESSYVLHLKIWKSFSSYSSLVDDKELPPGYDQLIAYNLAVILGAEFNSPVRPDVLQIALDTKAKIEELNNRFQTRKVKLDSSFRFHRHHRNYLY